MLKERNSQSAHGAARVATEQHPAAEKIHPVIAGQATWLHNAVNRGATPMTATAHSIRREAADVEPWVETCGLIRCLISEEDQAAAEVHHLQITDAKLHYHERTDEIYYVIDGRGQMRLDDEVVDYTRAWWCTCRGA